MRRVATDPRDVPEPILPLDRPRLRGTTWRRRQAPSTGDGREFDVAALDSLPTVEILNDYAGFDSTLMRAAVARKPRGIVLTSFAGGRLSAGGRAALRFCVVDPSAHERHVGR